MMNVESVRQILKTEHTICSTIVLNIMCVFRVLNVSTYCSTHRYIGESNVALEVLGSP